MADEIIATNCHITDLLRKLQGSSASRTTKALTSLSKATRKSENVVKCRKAGAINVLLSFLRSSNKKNLDMAVSVLANCAMEKQSRSEVTIQNSFIHT